MGGRDERYLDENDVRAGFGEGNRHVCTNAAGAACDDGGAALEGEEGGEGRSHCWGWGFVDGGVVGGYVRFCDGGVWGMGYLRMDGGRGRVSPRTPH